MMKGKYLPLYLPRRTKKDRVNWKRYHTLLEAEGCKDYELAKKIFLIGLDLFWAFNNGNVSDVVQLSKYASQGEERSTSKKPSYNPLFAAKIEKSILLLEEAQEEEGISLKDELKQALSQRKKTIDRDADQIPAPQ